MAFWVFKIKLLVIPFWFLAKEFETFFLVYFGFNYFNRPKEFKHLTSIDIWIFWMWIGVLPCSTRIPCWSRPWNSPRISPERFIQIQTLQTWSVWENPATQWLRNLRSSYSNNAVFTEKLLKIHSRKSRWDFQGNGYNSKVMQVCKFFIPSTVIVGSGQINPPSIEVAQTGGVASVANTTTCHNCMKKFVRKHHLSVFFHTFLFDLSTWKMLGDQPKKTWASPVCGESQDSTLRIEVFICILWMVGLTFGAFIYIYVYIYIYISRLLRHLYHEGPGLR